MKAVLSISTNKNKRFKVKLYKNNELQKTIHFGSKNPTYGTFLEHKNDAYKDAYIKRHQVNEDWTNPKTAGFWSRWILWSKPTLRESMLEAVKQSQGKITKIAISLKKE